MSILINNNQTCIDIMIIMNILNEHTEELR